MSHRWGAKYVFVYAEGSWALIYVEDIDVNDCVSQPPNMVAFRATGYTVNVGYIWSLLIGIHIRYIRNPILLIIYFNDFWPFELEHVSDILSGTPRWPSSLGILIRLRPHHCSSIARPSPLNSSNEYVVLVLGKETAVQAVVGGIVWTFRRLKKPRNGEMSARGYALHSVCPQLPFSLFLLN